jgi:aminoglycoside phosphotransferase (APT) family kinase protein
MPDASGLHIDNLAYPKGAGQSHETILFDAHWDEHGAARTQGLVVRIKPGSFTVFPDTLFEEQYRLMTVLHEGNAVRVARPLWFEADASVLGSPFFVMEKVIGRVPVSIPPYAQTGWVANATPVQRRTLWENGVRQLAACQSVPLSGVSFLAGPAHAYDGLAQEWDKFSRFVEWMKPLPAGPILAAGHARLLGLWPDHQPAGLVWGDARLGNMMFDDHYDVVAVMDWEQPSLGGALNDLAWWVTLSDAHHRLPDGSWLAGMGTRAETITLWHELTGISVEDVEWYEGFTILKLSCLAARMADLRGAPSPDLTWLAQRLKVDGTL